MVGTPLTSVDPVEIGSYTLVSRLGEGGMGVVYLATNDAGKRVALKVIRPHLASHDQFLERFRSEVALARKVARFCTAPILDSDTTSDPPYIVSEYVDGPTLTAAVAENGPLSGSELHALGVGVASALTAIHRAGIVHRDLKPSNVLLSRYGPRVIDFGIAKAVDAITDITQTGQFVGSPSYTAPERYLGEPITPFTDIFAWGSVLAYAGTGKAPFGGVAEAIAYRVVHGEPDLEGLDPQLADLVAWTLSKKPGERPTAQQLLDTLLDQERTGSHQPVRPLHSRVVSPPSSSPPPSAELTTVVHESGSTVTAPLPSERRSVGKVVAISLAVALLFGAAATGGWWAWDYAKQQRAAGESPLKPSPTATPSPSAPPEVTTTAVTKDDKAQGPAKPVDGAKPGGIVTALDSNGFGTLDPQRVYDERTMSMGSALLFRSLTGYIDNGKGGLKLVGDLATTTGTPSNDLRTWSYTLRPGVAFQDGTPITAADVAYGVARAFAKEVEGGPPYVQNWLMDTPTMSGTAFREKWAGPYGEGKDAPPRVEVLSPTELRFSFNRSHPEFPMVAALGTTSPVPKSRDTRGAYGDGTALVASGPYRIASRSSSRLELVRNDKWKPETDPIRHAYPDKWVFKFGVSTETATDRIIKSTGENAAAFTWNNLPPSRDAGVVKQYLLDAPTPTQHFLAINTLRVTKVEHRKAISAAIDRGVAMDKYRGATHGRPSYTILSSAMPGFNPHKGLGDLGPKANKDLARSLLKGDTPALTIAYNTRSASDKRLVTYVESALEEVGFTVTLAPLDGVAFWSAIEDPNNTYDLHPYFWGPDLPDGTGVFDHLFDDNTVGRPGNRNTSFFHVTDIWREILRLQTEPNRSTAAAAYGELDEKILKDYAPVVPLFEQQQLSVFGKKLHGLYVHRVFGSVGLTDAHVS